MTMDRALRAPGLASRDRAIRARPIAIRAMAWGVAVVAVGTPAIMLDVAGVAAPAWLPTASLGLAAATLLLSIAWRPMRPLARFFAVLVLLQPAVHSGPWPSGVRAWQAPLPGAQSLPAEFILELAVAGAIVAVLLLTGLRRRATYLAVGRLDAPVQPVRFLIDRPLSWARLGPVSAALIGLGTLGFLLVAGNAPTVDRVLAVLPAVLVIAALNALNEEVIFRAGPVAALDGIIGRRQLVLLVVVVFAIPHYFGVPFGLPGVAMAAVFAWWTTKALLETRGLFWPWFIHLVQDVLIFIFILAGALG